MKNKFYLFAFTCIVLSACENSNKNTAEEKVLDDTTPAVANNETPAPPMDSAAMMQAWQAYMTPGDVHKMMDSWNGKWTAEMTMWMDPQKPPTTNTANVENKMILGGRYQQSTYKGNMDGMPFEGMSTLGYDNKKKTFMNTWVDNMGTGIMYTEGTWDEASKTVNFKGECVDPATGKIMKVREVYTIVDDETHTMTMYMTSEGAKEMKSMEIKLAKK